MLTVEEMNKGFARERELYKALHDAELDVRLAERSKNDDEIKAAKDAKLKASADWYAQGKANCSEVVEFLKLHGIDVTGAKHAFTFV